MSTAPVRPVQVRPVRSGTARALHPVPEHPAGTGRLRRFLACAGRAVRAAHAARVPF